MINVKRIIKHIGLAIAGFAIMVFTWTIGNLIRSNNRDSNSESLKDKMKKSEKDLESDAQNINKTVTEVQKIQEEAQRLKDTDPTPERRLDYFEHIGIIRRRKKD